MCHRNNLNLIILLINSFPVVFRDVDFLESQLFGFGNTVFNTVHCTYLAAQPHLCREAGRRGNRLVLVR